MDRILLFAMVEIMKRTQFSEIGRLIYNVCTRLGLFACATSAMFAQLRGANAIDTVDRSGQDPHTILSDAINNAVDAESPGVISADQIGRLYRYYYHSFLWDSYAETFRDTLFRMHPVLIGKSSQSADSSLLNIGEMRSLLLLGQVDRGDEFWQYDKKFITYARPQDDTHSNVVVSIVDPPPLLINALSWSSTQLRDAGSDLLKALSNFDDGDDILKALSAADVGNEILTVLRDDLYQKLERANAFIQDLEIKGSIPLGIDPVAHRATLKENAVNWSLMIEAFEAGNRGRARDLYLARKAQLMPKLAEAMLTGITPGFVDSIARINAISRTQGLLQRVAAKRSRIVQPL